MFEVEFNTENEAFCNEMTGEEDSYVKALECQRILTEIIKKLEVGYRNGSCIDLNGNKVGEWKLR